MGQGCSSSKAPNAEASEGGGAGYQKQEAAAAPKKKGAGPATTAGVGHLGAEIGLDPVTKHDIAQFDALEAELTSKLTDKAAMTSMWKSIDFNGNNMVSLAEIDKWVVDPANKMQILNHKPALMRAYKLTIATEGKHTNRETDFLHRKEFPTLIRNLFYYNKIYQIFEEMANSPTERRIDLDNFIAGSKKMGIACSDEEAKAEFHEIVGANGKEILFDQFCHYVMYAKFPGVADIDDQLAPAPADVAAAQE